MAGLNSSGAGPGDAEPGLLGVEIGRSKVRLVLLDREGRSIRDAVERPIAKAGGPRDPIEEEYSTRSAVEAALGRLDLDVDHSGRLAVGATIGFANCGVGSGPAIRDWLATLSEEIGEPLVYSGDTGISYAPSSCIEFVRRIFDPLQLRLDRVELAPVAASRCLGLVPSGAMTLGSGVAWSARILNNNVLEAFETIDGSVDEVMQYTATGRQRELDSIEGVDVDPSLLRGRGLAVGSLGPSVGVAVGLIDADASNLLAGTRVGDGRQYGAPAPAYGGPGGENYGGYGAATQAVPSVAPSPDAGPSDPWAAPDQPDYHGAGADAFPGGGGGDGFAGRRELGDSRNLRRLPRRLERSRDLGSATAGGSLGRPREPRPGQQPRRDDMAGIDAFAHPGEAGSGRGFHVSDFVLGALGMLAVMLVIALVVL